MPKKGEKFKFEESLERIPEALEWAEKQDVERLRRFFIENSNIPLYCFSSGGASSPLEYAALLYETNQGMAKALTPLMMASISDAALKRAKILIVTGDGNGHDEKYTSKRAAKVNPDGVAAIVRDSEVDNYVINTLKKVTSNWFIYNWLVPDGEGTPFIATIETICQFGLFYKAFTSESEIKSKLEINLDPNACFTYQARKEGNVPKLNQIKNFIVLYAGWSKPVATDFECKMIESGFASVQLCDYRNFCHGRFIFLSKHLEDSALVLFLTPREQKFARDLILEAVSWMDNEEMFPKNTPIVKIETEFDSPIATIDLMIKMQVFFNEVAKEFKLSDSDDPCNPDNPCGIDKRFPRSTEFKGLLEMGALGNGEIQGSIGTLKSVNRKTVIKYDPKKSVEQLAKSNGVTVPTIRKFILDKRIDRKRDERMLVYNRVWLEYIQDSDISQAALARKLKMSVNTIKEYLGTEAKKIEPEEGKIGMASEHPKVKKLREAIPVLQKRFERFRVLRARRPDLSEEDCLKKLSWSKDRKGKNLTIVTQFMQMKEFKYKFKNKEIKLIPND